MFSRSPLSVLIEAACIPLAVLAFTFLAPAADPQPEPDYRGRFPVESAIVIDGDTVYGAVKLPWGVSLDRQKIRALGYDAWESSRYRQSVDVTDDEITKGKRATTELTELLADGARLYVTPQGGGFRDPYGRLLAELHVKTKDGQWVDVAKWMRERGHTRKETK